jgi:ribonuclease E
LPSALTSPAAVDTALSAPMVSDESPQTRIAASPVAPLSQAVPNGAVAAAGAAPVAPAASAPTPAVIGPGAAAATAPASFVLPVDELQSIAQTAGLEWVGSDADKIRVAEEAMSNEPAPQRVARERKPAVDMETGPLVLVETRKDLSSVKLPFESATSPSN